MDEYTVNICMDAERADMPYYCEVRERESDDILFRGPHADTRQMAKYHAMARLVEMQEAVAGRPPTMPAAETFADIHKN